MSDEPHTIPDHVASRIDRLVNEAEDMRQQASDDLKQIYADLREELRGMGWNGATVSAEIAALKGAILEMRLDDKEKAKREEKGERRGDYVSLLTRARARSSQSYAEVKGRESTTPEASNSKAPSTETDALSTASTSEILPQEQPVDPATKFQAKASEDNGATGTAIDEVPSDSMAGEVSRSSDRDECGATTSENGRDSLERQATQFSEPHSFGVDDGQRGTPSANVPAAQKVAAATAIARDGDKPVHYPAEFAHQPDSAAQDRNEPISASGPSITNFQSNPHAQPSSTAVSAAPSKTIRDYRPHCRHPDNCGGSGLKHCYECLKARDEAIIAQEAVA